MQEKVLLTEDEFPTHYYNILPDLPTSLSPVLHPGTREPIKAKEMEAIFAKELIRQEFSSERYIKIPEKVREALLQMGRPYPLFRARRLEEKLKTKSKIYYKYEGLNPCGSHKPNSAIPQAYYNALEGTQTLVTETGAGQWGSSLAYAAMLFGLKAKVFMVKVSHEQKPYRKLIMNAYGAQVYASPSNETQFGKKTLEQNPTHTGSLGIAISEAIETVANTPNSKYTLGSVLNHVLLHQTIIGQEAKTQLEKINETPDVIIGCVGGGSNFAGLALPFMQDKIHGKLDAEFIAVEPTACPTLTQGKYEYDFGDTAGLTPLLKMHTLGKDFTPSPIHAGGLRYHGMAPIISNLANDGLITPIAYDQESVFQAANTFIQSEGLIPAPESAHAIKATIDKAKQLDAIGESKTILFNLSGHGLLDMQAYSQLI